ncbi:EI24 domain-containing protein [Erythrobacter sp. R86502]|uniref:EI24 domain-containing protein n=1 Tax=Erythrobacter sp. R86502 TaxID=3093846 RepID=UPI0036D221D0
MSAVFAAIVKAFGQLGDRAVTAVLAKSIVITLLLFAMVGAGVYFGLAGAASRYGVAESWAGLATAVLVPIAMWLLFRIVALAVLQFFADGIVVAVEVRHYPALAARARPLPLRREAVVAIRGAMRALGANLLALPVAALLVFTAIGPAAVFLAVNAVLLGRELTDMAWLRHADGADSANPVSRPERVLLGAVIAGMMLVPFVNIIAPVIGAAAGTHLVLRRLDARGGKP